MTSTSEYFGSVVCAHIGAAVVVDQDGVIVAANKLARKAFGFEVGADFCAGFDEPKKARRHLDESAAATTNHLFQLTMAGYEPLAMFGSRLLGEPTQDPTTPKEICVLLRVETQSNLSERFTTQPSERLEQLNQRLRFEIERRLALELENASLEEEILRDPTTSLLTRSGLNQALRAHARESSELPLVMIFLDLNNFKSLNDQLGHDAGDLAIAEVGRILRDNLRQNDIAARLGGDEFAVVLKGPHSRDKIQKFVQRLHDLIGEAMEYRDPVTEQIHVFHLSFSAGVALYPSDTRDVSVLAAFADRAMYSAKERGVPTQEFTNRRDPNL